MEIDPRAEQRWSLCLMAGVGGLLLLMLLSGVVFPRRPLMEQRALAAAPAWPSSWRDLQQLPRSVDAFVQDHFPARTRLIGGLNMLRYLSGDSGVRSVIIGRHGWLFYDDGSHLGMAGVAPQDEEINRWVDQIDRWTRAVAARGGHFVMMIPPDKERIYPEQAPRWYVPNPNSPAERLVRAAQACGLENVLYLLPQLLRAKSETPPACNDTDTHWTGLGAHAASIALAERLRTTDAPIGMWPLDHYTQTIREKDQGLASMLGLKGWLTSSPFPLVSHPETDRKIKLSELSNWRRSATPLMYENDGSDGPVLLLVGDSFREQFLPLLLPHFRRIISCHYHDGAFRQDLIDQFAPDVVVLEVVERYAAKLFRKATR